MNSPNYKELFRETGCLSAEMLLRYRDGRLSQQDKHEAERHLIGCELCSDALEGFGVPHSAKAMADINSEINKRLTNGNTVSSKPYFAIAASLSALVLLSWFAWNQFSSVGDERLAVSENTTAEIKPEVSETAPSNTTMEQESVSSVPKYEPKPISDPNGNRSMVTSSDITSVQEESIEITESKARADDNISSPAESEAATDATTFSAAPSQSPAAGVVLPGNNQSHASNNVTYIDNLKVLDYDEGLAAGTPAVAATSANRKNSSNNRQNTQAGVAEESLNKKENNNYNSMVTGPLMLYNQAKYDAAIRGFDQLLRQNPNDQNAVYYKAMSNYHLGKFNPAIKLLEPLAADTNSPFMEEAMFYLAESYANSGKKVPAFNMYNNIIKNNNYNNQKARDNIKNLR